LINATITDSPGFTIPPEEQTQARKLLVKKSELTKLLKAKDEGKAIVPLALLTQGRYIKLKISVGKGRMRIDKRQNIKKREQAIEAERDLKRNFR
ncbi:MAG TPA: SsrA-binding protein, partial [Patescibacteria group bacterium]|nr:SsrA-binding protein [Patescibacteria group bacterium]